MFQVKSAERRYLFWKIGRLGQRVTLEAATNLVIPYVERRLGPGGFHCTRYHVRIGKGENIQLETTHHQRDLRVGQMLRPKHVTESAGFQTYLARSVERAVAEKQAGPQPAPQPPAPVRSAPARTVPQTSRMRVAAIREEQGSRGRGERLRGWAVR